jgi:hypothetical protein
MTYLLCLIEQGLGSVLNIGLNIWLIRAGRPELFGVFAFWFNIMLLAGSVQSGLALAHLLPLAPGAGTLPRRIGAERALLSASLAMVAVAAVLVALAVAAGGGRSDLAASGAIGMVPAYLAYQYARALAFSRGAIRTATCATATLVAASVAGLAVCARLPGGLGASAVLWAMGCAYGVAGIAATLHLAAGLRLRPRHLRLYGPYLARSRWSVLGVVCFEAMNRVPGFAVTFWLGAPALGRMSATQLPARPPILLVAALLPALRNDLVRLREAADWHRFAAHTLRGGVAALAVNALWAVPIGLGWPLLSRLVFHDRFSEDLALGLLWAASQAAGSLASVVGTSFQVCGAFRLIGYADLAAAGGTIGGLAVLLPAFGVTGAILATLLGQIAYIAATAALWPQLRAAFAPLTVP